MPLIDIFLSPADLSIRDQFAGMSPAEVINMQMGNRQNQMGSSFRIPAVAAGVLAIMLGFSASLGAQNLG
ncbi:MAG: hypothetical protein WAM65_02125, partial [Candidatus Korobacteraceae bacterium]